MSKVHVTPNSYGNSRAANMLEGMVREKGTSFLNKKINTYLRRLDQGFGELLKVDDPIRDDALLWWAEKVARDALTLRGEFDAADIPYTFMDNIITYRTSQARENGRVLEKLRGQIDDHSAILAELRRRRIEE